MGLVTQDGTLLKRIKYSKHTLKTPPALALSIESLDEAERNGAVRCEITDIESGRIFRATLATIRERGILIERGGFEAQLALPLERWAVTGPGEPIAEQLGLWG